MMMIRIQLVAIMSTAISSLSVWLKGEIWCEGTRNRLSLKTKSLYGPQVLEAFSLLIHRTVVLRSVTGAWLCVFFMWMQSSRNCLYVFPCVLLYTVTNGLWCAAMSTQQKLWVPRSSLACRLKIGLEFLKNLGFFRSKFPALTESAAVTWSTCMTTCLHVYATVAHPEVCGCSRWVGGRRAATPDQLVEQDATKSLSN